MDQAKIYTFDEMREMMIDTFDYKFIDECGEFIGTLKLKAQGKKNSIRAFFELEDGRKIVTPIFWWQERLGFHDMKVGAILKLSFSESRYNQFYLKNVEVIDEGNEADTQD